MNLKTQPIDKLFYLYCALVYNNNKTIRIPDSKHELVKKIVKMLKSKNVAQFRMDDHRYQYLLSLLNSENYEQSLQVNPNHVPVLTYIKLLSELPELQDLWKGEQVELNGYLTKYSEAINKIPEIFSKYFDFEPQVKDVIITRNVGKSGMLIPTSNVFYLIIGNITDEVNLRNLTHELLHAYLREANLPLNDDFRAKIDNLPAEILDNYKSDYTLIEEFVVRALVVYLSELEDFIPKQEFSEEDKLMKYPEIIYKNLKKEEVKKFSKDYFENLKI